MAKKKLDVSLLVWSEIDLDRLRRNLKVIRSILQNLRVGILAIVKADAYGHGMKSVALTLAKEGVNFFGVANIEEAMELHKVCSAARILVLGGFHQSQIPLFIRHRITPTIFSLDDIAHFEKALRGQRFAFPVHVKIDTGMGRLGVWHEEVSSFFSRLKEASAIEVEGVYTHFSSADHKDLAVTKAQMALFDRAIKGIKAMGFSPKYFHAANSTGLMRFKNSHLNLVRPGILLYGIIPYSHGRLPKGIRPILSLKTRISFLKEVGKGRSISYGATYKTACRTRIATLPVGYSHGYRVGFSNKAFVAVRGRKCPVVGRVTMDHTLIDVGKVPAARRWDEVTLIGTDGKAEVMAQDLADLIDSIPYEIVCAIHSRIPRIYKGF